MRIFKTGLLWLCMASTAAVPASVYANDFYKDKTIRFVVGYSAGGSFDLYTRVIGRHFSRHVPGQSDRHR